MATSQRLQPMQDQLMFLSEELPASHSASLGSEADWLMSVVTWRSNFLGLLIACAPSGFSGRTYPACFPAFRMTLPIHVIRRHQWTWSSTDRRWKLQTNTIQKSYTPSTVFWPDWQNSGTGSLTGFSTLNSLEYHSGAVASSLSDILETGDVPRRFYLSATACRGILRRAEKRGKTLPAALQHALQQVADSERTSTSGGGYELSPALSASGRGVSRAGESRGQDCVIPILEAGARTGHSTDDIRAGGMGRIDYETETLVTHALRGVGFDASEDGTGRGTPLVPVAIGFYANDSGNDAGLDVSPTLRSMEGGGGNHPAVALAIRGRDGVPQIEMGDEVANAILTPNGGRGGIGVGAMMQGSAVRRLTPLECCRLQGFPDDYFTGVRYKGKPLADGPIYKMLGNSMAVPCMRWIGERIQMVEAA